MKKLFLVAAVALLATSVFASDMKFDAKVGYAKIQNGGSGFVVGPGMYYSLYQGDGFVKDFSLGMGLDFTMAKFAGAWGYNMFFGPEGRLEMPYSYAKLGFGYDYFRNAGVNSNMLAMKVGVGFLYPIADATKLGLDFTFGYTLTQGNVGSRMWMINVGPVVSFDL